jgi:putative aldouronate transport system permease protein
LLINNYLPIFGLVIAFKDINFKKGILGSDWVGLKNFEYLFKTRDAFIITRNTLLYNFSFIILGIIAGVFFAILLNEIKKKALLKTYQTIILLPHLVSWVIASYFTYSLLAVDTGMLNKTILPLLGIDEISWFTEPKYWPGILTIAKLWKTFGFSCIFYFATVVGISKEYYEAAEIDGASKMQQIRHITLPLLVPTIVILFLLNMGRIFYAEFGLFYQVPLNSGALYRTTNVIDTYVFRSLLQLGDIGMSAAAGFYQSIVGFVLVLVSNTIAKKAGDNISLF